MTILRTMTIDNFTVFKHAEFEFCDGINVLIGANGAGKTHVLKLAYVYLRSSEEGHAESERIKESAMIRNMREVFRPAEGRGTSLVRRQNVSCDAEILYRMAMPTREPDEMRFTLDRKRGPDDTGWGYSGSGTYADGARPVFMPSREALAMFEGFAALWEKRELSFDRTYYDLCRNLELAELKDVPEESADLIEFIGGATGGKAVLSDGRFYMEDDRGKLEAHLLAEGHRKLACIQRLLANGVLSKGATLVWDEPEANLNPVLVTKVVEILHRLARMGIQIFVATHDYLLLSELSLASEHGLERDVQRRFFALTPNPKKGTQVDIANVIADLSDNPIVDEYAAHYKREQRLFHESLSKPQAS